MHDITEDFSFFNSRYNLSAFLFFLKIFLLGVQLIYNVALICAEGQSELVVRIHAQPIPKAEKSKVRCGLKGNLEKMRVKAKISVHFSLFLFSCISKFYFYYLPLAEQTLSVVFSIDYCNITNI